MNADTDSNEGNDSDDDDIEDEETLFRERMYINISVFYSTIIYN